MGASVIAGGDAAPVIEPAERALDQIALLVDFGVVGDRDFAARAPKNAGRDFLFGYGLAEPIAIIFSVCDHRRRV